MRAFENIRKKVKFYIAGVMRGFQVYLINHKIAVLDIEMSIFYIEYTDWKRKTDILLAKLKLI